MEKAHDVFGARAPLDTAGGRGVIYRLDSLEKSGHGAVSRLPFSIKVLLEALLRNCDGILVTEEDVTSLAQWNAKVPARREVPFKPARVILQDFTGVPAVVDLAAMRAAMKRLGGDATKINPLVPVDLVIDHSVQVDFFGNASALERNAEIEFQRNRERYEFLRWGQQAFQNFRVVPPATGIVHQVNLEFLAKVVLQQKIHGETVLLPDTLVGTDSHTTMINGLGVLGWGVGGIEAEAAMLGQPYYFLTPKVVGFRLRGKLKEGVTATDLVLTVTQILRKRGVVDQFVEFFGEGLAEMTLADRATVANMSPEYGATMGFFPIDAETLRYLRQTGRTDEEVDRVERYAKEQGIFRTNETPDPEFTDVLELDLATVEPSLAGPKRPQDRVPLSQMKQTFHRALSAPVKDRGFGLSAEDTGRRASCEVQRRERRVGSRGGGDCRHHFLHEHFQSIRHAGSGLGGQEGAGKRFAGSALRQNQPRTRLESGDGLFAGRGIAGAARRSALQPGGLWLHHVHRQQRAPAAGGGERGHRGPIGGCGSSFRQSQFRGPRASASSGKLFGFPAAGGGVRVGRHGRYRSGYRTPGKGPPGRGSLPSRYLAFAS